MSMHMIKGVQVHGKTRKKKKLTENQLEKLKVEWRQYNKRMRQTHNHRLQFNAFEDYLSYVRGEYKPKRKEEFKPYVPPETTRRETKPVPSLSPQGAIPANGTAKQEPKQYTGDYIIGIATMHKSNLVPVGRGSDPTDYATMRRN